MYPLSNDSQFSLVLLETLAQSGGHGASAGEVLTAATTIESGNFESFYSSFYGLANRLKAVADTIDARRFPVSAHEAYFRIATYFRAADFFLHGNVSDPRIYSLWDSQTAAFDKAISLLPVPGKRIMIQGKGFQIPAIFYSPPHSNCSEPKPTILVGNGYDAAQEESLHFIGFEILDRGWNFVTYEGPGQPTVRRNQNLGFIPEWWEVVTPVVDYLSTRSDVDMSSLALTGISFGGSLAPRAAAYDHRFAAVIAIDGMYSLQAAFEADFPSVLVELFKSGNKTAFDFELNQIRHDPTTPSGFRWVIDQGLFAFHTLSPFDWFSQLGAFSLDGLYSKITCPVFVGDGQDDMQVPGQAQIVADALGDRATLYKFNNSLGAGQHCQLGAEPYLAQASLDWFQGVLDKKHQ
jgi:alpha-beta hydrolase superfamily lysophospholipase